MDFDLPPPDDPRRLAVRRWLEEHPEPTGAELAEAGYVAPQLPPPWGLGADPEHQLIVAEELAGVPMPDNPIGIGWAAPTLVAGGTVEQQQRFLPPLLSGAEYWCQLFSEPGAGSDLASLSTRAVRDGDDYVVNGSKIWSTWAHRADWGILLARTDPDAPKHRGISYFVLDMHADGVETRPITEMTGQSHFNEVFFTNVRVPASHRIGAEGEGWRLANVTLGNERLTLSEGGVLWGMGPTSDEIFARLRSEGVGHPLERQEAARLYIRSRILQLLGFRILTQVQAGESPATVAAVKKLSADIFGQDVMNFMKDRKGAAGMVGPQSEDAEHRDVWHWGFLFSRALTIGGGTSEVLRNIIGERILGLPKEPAP